MSSTQAIDLELQRLHSLLRNRMEHTSDWIWAKARIECLQVQLCQALLEESKSA